MAQTYLSTGDTNFLLANNNTFVFGQSGTESVFIRSGVTGVVTDQNTDRVDFEGAAGDFTYQQAGNQLLVFSNGVKAATIPIKSSGTQLVFSDGSTDAQLSLGVMTIGGSTVSSVAGTVTPGTMDAGTTSSGSDSGANNAMTFLDTGDTNYQIVNTGTSVFASSGTESFLIAPGVTGIKTDQNAERVDIQGNVADFTYQQAGNQLIVLSNGSKVASIPVQSDGTQLVFSNGSVNVMLQIGVMTLGGTTVSATPGAVVPTTIDTGTTAGDGGGQSTAQTVSADTGSVVAGAVNLDASGGAYNFTDDATVENKVVIGNFTSDDTITVSNATASDYSFSNDGTDVDIIYNNAGTVNQITLTGVVSTNDLVYDQASFESAIGFDAFTTA